MQVDADVFCFRRQKWILFVFLWCQKRIVPSVLTFRLMLQWFKCGLHAWVVLVLILWSVHLSWYIFILKGLTEGWKKIIRIHPQGLQEYWRQTSYQTGSFRKYSALIHGRKKRSWRQTNHMSNGIIRNLQSNKTRKKKGKEKKIRKQQWVRFKSSSAGLPVAALFRIWSLKKMLYYTALQGRQLRHKCQ